MAIRRVAFLTTGQSPRTDLVPEMVDEIGKPIEVIEAGMLDDLTAEEIESLRPAEGAPVIVSRLRDGSEVVMDHRKVAAGLQPLIDRQDADALVLLLCTGSFPALSARQALIKAGPVVDDRVEALGRSGRRIGVMVPGAAQVRNYHGACSGSGSMIAAYASPYGEPRWQQAVDELGEADVIVMHCMGYDRAMREQIAVLSGKPVLLSRSLVAAAVGEVV